MKPPTPAQAYWNQRQVVAGRRQRILDLNRAVDFATDLALFQWAQLMAYILEFGPDLIVELGRGKGNSTCVFTEAANVLGAGRCRVLSLDVVADWEERTVPALRRAVPQSWFQPLQALRTDILTFDFAAALQGAGRVLVFWDAHGFAVAECVLSRIMPVIVDRPHVVLMHDMTDTRYCKSVDNYSEVGIWKGESDWKTAKGATLQFQLGHISTHVAQVIPALDFAQRNGVSLDSADHSYQTELATDSAKMVEMRRLLGDQFFALQAHWFWFSLNHAKAPYVFPAYNPQVTSYEQLYEKYHHQCQVQEQVINDLYRDMMTYYHRYQELAQSRWRRLGRRLRLVRRSSWEHQTAQKN
jgi:hypothetical protein